MVKKLTDEEKLDVRELSSHSGYPSLLKWLDSLVEGKERLVLNYKLVGGDLAELANLKCAAEGARSLISTFKQDVDGLKERSSKKDKDGVIRNKKYANRRR